MSITRRNKRAQQRESYTHFSVFGSILMGFYEFLEKTPKPSDEEVRAEFIKREQRWKQYCQSHKLNAAVSQLFNKEVSASWKKRYKKQDEQTEK